MLQLRCKAIYFRAVFAVKIRHISNDGGRKKRFAVLAPDHNKHFTKDARSVLFDDPEHNGNGGFLPQLQLQKVCASFAMMAKVFDEPNCLVCLLRVEGEKPFLKPLHDVFIQKANPLADGYISGRNAVVILVNVI